MVRGLRRTPWWAWIGNLGNSRWSWIYSLCEALDINAREGSERLREGRERLRVALEMLVCTITLDILSFRLYEASHLFCRPFPACALGLRHMLWTGLVITCGLLFLSQQLDCAEMEEHCATGLNIPLLAWYLLQGWRFAWTDSLQVSCSAPCKQFQSL